mgnify:FL=1
MAVLTASEISAIVATRGERVFLNLSNQSEKDIDKASEVPGSNPTLPNPTPILGADANAIGIMGKPISTSAPVNGDYMRYDSALEKWVYNAGGGGSGSTITIRAVDGTPTNVAATLQFQETSGFTLANSLDVTTIDLLAVPVNKLAALTASRALASDASGFLVATSTSSAKLAFLDNVTSDIQTQINGIAGGGGITTLTGDVTATGTGSVAATLAASGITAGTYTKITVDAKGRATVGANIASGDLPSHTHAFATQVSGVVLTSPTNGQFLQFNGTNWINASVASSGNATCYAFTVNFDGSGNPLSTSGLPSGWSTSIAGSEVTVTHNIGTPPKSISYFGLNTDSGSVWRYRLPTAANEVKYNNATLNTEFIVTVNTSITGASLSSSAKVNILA